MFKLQRKYLVFFLLAFFVFLTVTFLNKLLTKKLYRLEKLKNELKEMEIMNDLLKLKLEKLKSYERLETVAKKNKFILIQKDKILQLNLWEK